MHARQPHLHLCNDCCTQGMLGSMQGGQPGTGFNYVPATGGLMQAMTTTDGTNTNTTVGVDPSMAANTTQAYDPATNTLTTTTVDPITGALGMSCTLSDIRTVAAYHVQHTWFVHTQYGGVHSHKSQGRTVATVTPTSSLPAVRQMCWTGLLLTDVGSVMHMAQLARGDVPMQLILLPPVTPPATCNA